MAVANIFLVMQGKVWDSIVRTVSERIDPMSHLQGLKWNQAAPLIASDPPTVLPLQ